MGGILREQVADNFATGHSTTTYSLQSGGKTTPVVPTRLSSAGPGDRVEVTGSVEHGNLVGAVQASANEAAISSATQGSGAGGTPIASQTPAEQGTRKVAVLLIKFPGDPTVPWSPEETRSKLFTESDSANAFYQEESYGQISLSGKLNSNGDVFGWYTIAGPTDGCPDTTWQSQADQAAQDAGVDLSGYDDIIYVTTPQASCGFNGESAVNGSWVQINGDLGAKTLTHELGHNMGLLHAGSETCTSGGVGVQISDNCTTNEYGDPFDTQGNIATRHHNGYNLAELGILAPENIETITADGDYTVKSALNQTTDPTVLRIARERDFSGQVTSWYYLEVRQTGGVFENVTDASTTGVSIRATTEDVFSRTPTVLLDCNPATSTFNDAPCGVGEAFDDPVGVRVTTLAAGGGSATVSVDLDTEPPSTPTNLTATTDASGVQLRWDASTDNVGVDHYDVYRDGTRIAVPAGTSYLDSLASSGDHTYEVYAEDLSGNQSAPSTVTLTVPEFSGPTCTNALCAVTFRYSGSAKTWTVPPGVADADFTVDGAQGGSDNPNSTRGRGAQVVAPLGSLSAGEAVTLSVGGIGRTYAAGGAGGFNGGGDGMLGGGGGGFSSVVVNSALTLLAGGGGGQGLNGINAATGSQGGAGLAGYAGEFGLPGLNGGMVQNAYGATLGGGRGGAAGGDGGAGGAGGEVTGSSTCPGGAFAGASGEAGGSFFGGGGAPGAGGGGGGGYVGGGQGGGGASDACGSTAASGGGGGSSSFAAGGLSAQFTGGIHRGDGQISIAYSNPIGPATHSYTTPRDQQLVVPAGQGVLSGATAPNGDPLSASAVSDPAHGSLALDPDGSFTYTPASGYVGGDSFKYQAADPSGDYASATVTLQIAAPPSASISAPADGATYTLGQSVPTTFSCSEGLGGPGLSSCDDSTGTQTATGGSGHLDTSTVGDHAYTVTVTSQDGATESASISYTVAPASPTATIISPVSGLCASGPQPIRAGPGCPATYAVGQSVRTSFSCAEGDGGPGLSSCDDSTGTKTVDGGSSRLDTSTPGTHNYVVTATSKDGKTGRQSIIYNVTPPPLAVTIETRWAIATGGQTKLRLACDGGPSGSACQGTLSLTFRQRLVRHMRHRRNTTFKTIIFGRASYMVSSGQRQLVELRLSDTAQRLLRRAAHPWLRVEAGAKPTGGAGAHREIALRLQGA